MILFAFGFFRMIQMRKYKNIGVVMNTQMADVNTTHVHASVAGTFSISPSNIIACLKLNSFQFKCLSRTDCNRIIPWMVQN